MFAVLALCAAVSLSVSVGGFSSVSAERGVSVTVVENEDAFLGVPESELSCGNSNRLFYNRFSEPVTDGRVEVTPREGELKVKRDSGFETYNQPFTLYVTGNVTPGEGFPFHITPVNESATEVEMDIDVSGPGFDISTTSERGVSCEKRNLGSNSKNQDNRNATSGRGNG